MNCFSPGDMDLQKMPTKDVGFNPEVILRRFYKIGVNFSENAILKKNVVKSSSRKIQKSCCVSD